MSYRETLAKIGREDFSKATAAERERAARDVIELSSYACAALALQPMPGLEQAILPVQVGMVLTIAHVYGKKLSKKHASEVLFDVAAITGVSLLGRQALLTFAKVALPFVSGVLGAPYVFSVTWGTGYAALHYLSRGGRPDKAKIRAIFEAERARGKKSYSPGKAEAAREDEP